MSAIGVALSRALGALGGPTTAAIVVAAGLAAGALGGGLVAGGASSQAATAGATLAVYPCPGTGAPLAFVRAGQQLLATGRTADSAWLRIHLPEPGRNEAWVQAGPLESRGNLASLPVAECAPEVAAALPSLAPQPSLTALQDNPPSAPPSAEPTPTPTPTAPPNGAPSLSGLSASTNTISYDTGGYCPAAVKKATFTVRASDDVGIASVALFWRGPGTASPVQAAMTRTSGSATRGTWQVSLTAGASGITKAGKLTFYAIGIDTSGAQKRIPVSGTDSITVAVCQNAGPAITGASSSSGSSLYWDPLGVGRCQTASNLTATIKDTDGVRSATLFYRKPGSSSWSSKRMDDTTIKGKWYANLDTLGDRITIPNPPTGSLKWYIKAVDDKGLAAQSKTFTLTIRRCDTEASFGNSTPPSLVCPNQDNWFYGSASDPDGINGSSAVLVYTYWRKDGTQRTAKKRMTGNNDGNWYYSVSLRPGADWDLRRVPLTFYILTTDRYGGTSKGGSGKTTVTSC